jgi:hypothetical protein
MIEKHELAKLAFICELLLVATQQADDGHFMELPQPLRGCLSTYR